MAVEAVFHSWDGARAVAYRTREHIPHDLGTAVNVQAMVFGNRDDNSGTGVGFTRNPATGERAPYGDFLLDAQGEDVVAGIRQTEPLSALADRFPAIHAELLDIFDRLERHYRDMLDTEFTIEQGKLWMLQTRVGKRTGRAALRMAVEMTTEPDIAPDPRRGRHAGHARAPRPAAAPPARGRAPRAWWPEGLAASPGRRHRSGLLRRRRRGGRGGPRRAGGPGAHRDVTRRRGRHAGRRGRADQPRRARQPRRGRGPGLGHPGGGGGRSHHRRAPPLHRRRHHRPRGRVALGRRHVRRGDARPARAGPGRATARVRHHPGLGRRHPAGPHRGAGQRRQRSGRGPGPRVRRRGHRAVPHRAHVPGRQAARWPSA